MRVESTEKIRGYTGYLTGEENRSLNGRIYLTIYRYDVPENIAEELIEKGATRCAGATPPLAPMSDQQL